MQLPEDAQARKDIPMMRGCVDYFAAALAAVAELSRLGNEQHNPGEEMHHARGKSADHADCLLRHLVDRGGFFEIVHKTDGKVLGRVRHSVAVAWRALALAQLELEADGAPMARGARDTAAPAAKPERFDGIRRSLVEPEPVGLPGRIGARACGCETPGCTGCGEFP